MRYLKKFESYDEEVMSVASEIADNKRILKEIQNTPIEKKIEYAKSLEDDEVFKFNNSGVITTEYVYSNNSKTTKLITRDGIEDYKHTDMDKIIAYRGDDDFGSYAEFVPTKDLYVPTPEERARWNKDLAFASKK